MSGETSRYSVNDAPSPSEIDAIVMYADRPAVKATAETLAWGAEARVYDGPTDWVGRPATEAGERA